MASWSIISHFNTLAYVGKKIYMFLVVADIQNTPFQ